MYIAQFVWGKVVVRFFPEMLLFIAMSPKSCLEDSRKPHDHQLSANYNDDQTLLSRPKCVLVRGNMILIFLVIPSFAQINWRNPRS